MSLVNGHCCVVLWSISYTAQGEFERAIGGSTTMLYGFESSLNRALNEYSRLTKGRDASAYSGGQQQTYDVTSLDVCVSTATD